MQEQPTERDGLEADDIDEAFVPRFRDDVAAVELDGEAVLLDGESGAVHTLNPIATLVWKCCDATTSLRRIIDDLAGFYVDTEREAISTDVVALVRDMGRQGLLHNVAPAIADKSHAHSHDHDHDDDPGGRTA